MVYLNQRRVKRFIHENGKRVSKDGLHLIEVQFVQYLDKLCKVHNGGLKTIDARLVSSYKSLLSL